MDLQPLATTDDLKNAGVDTSDTARTKAALAAASAQVRAAAGGVTISRHTGRVTIDGTLEPYLAVPGWAVTEVTDITLDDTPVVDARWQAGSQRLWRSRGWQRHLVAPSQVTMTITQGVTTVPADIVELVVALAAAALAVTDPDDGYASRRGVAYERIDDYQVGLQQGEQEIVSPVELPERTRAALEARFGAQTAVVGSY